MKKTEYFTHRKNYWMRQGFSEDIAELTAESDWRRYNVDKLQYENKRK
jgi:hypothetical protein